MYLTRNMVALKPITYLGRDLKEGEAFQATSDDAGYFVKHQKAADAAPTASPALATATPSAVAQPSSEPAADEAAAGDGARPDGEAPALDAPAEVTEQPTTRGRGGRQRRNP